TRPLGTLLRASAGRVSRRKAPPLGGAGVLACTTRSPPAPAVPSEAQERCLRPQRLVPIAPSRPHPLLRHYEEAEGRRGIHGQAARGTSLWIAPCRRSGARRLAIPKLVVTFVLSEAQA